jgi:hypothetical protein
VSVREWNERGEREKEEEKFNTSRVILRGL